jgi:hypothetical protein
MLSFKNVRRIRAMPRQQINIVRAMHKKDFQLLRCLFVQNIVYIIRSSFLATYTIYTAATKYQIQTPWEQSFNTFFFNLSTVIYQIPYCVSFIVYITVSKAFYQEVKRLVYKIWNRHPPPRRQNRIDVDEELNIVSTIALRA